jgi:hypothetical protein
MADIEDNEEGVRTPSKLKDAARILLLWISAFFLGWSLSYRHSVNVRSQLVEILGATSSTQDQKVCALETIIDGNGMTAYQHCLDNPDDQVLPKDKHMRIDPRQPKKSAITYT